MTIDFAAVAKELDSATSKMAGIAERAAVIAPEAGGLKAYCDASKVQIPDAVALIATLLANHSAAVLSGSAPPTLRSPEPPFVEPVKERPLTVQLFALRAVRWKDETGQQQIGGKFRDVYLTKSAAARALAIGACVEISNPLRRKHHGWSTEVPRLDRADDLDAAEPARQARTPVEPELHSAFQPVDSGPAFTLRVAK